MSIGGIVKPQGIGTTVLDMEDDKGKLHNLNFENVCYFPGAPKILISPQKLACDIGEAKVDQEGTYLKVMGKCSILASNNGKY